MVNSLIGYSKTAFLINFCVFPLPFSAGEEEEEEEVEMREGWLVVSLYYNDKELFKIAVMDLLLGIKTCIIRRFRW